MNPLKNQETLRTFMHKLKILWKNRNTWRYAFIEWKIVMFPHLYPKNWDEVDGSYWFYEALNNYDGIFDEWL